MEDSRNCEALVIQFDRICLKTGLVKPALYRFGRRRGAALDHLAAAAAAAVDRGVDRLGARAKIHASAADDIAPALLVAAEEERRDGALFAQTVHQLAGGRVGEHVVKNADVALGGFIPLAQKPGIAHAQHAEALLELGFGLEQAPDRRCDLVALCAE